MKSVISCGIEWYAEVYSKIRYGAIITSLRHEVHAGHFEFSLAVP